MKTQSQNSRLSLIIMCIIIIFSSLLFSCFPEKTTLPVVHQKKSESDGSLQQDKLRVETIEARLKSADDSETSKLPVGIETSSGSYVINNIVLGNVAPPLSSTDYKYYFHLDTLIDQFWVRCLQAPCGNDANCPSTTYNPHDSTTYKEIDCKSSMCTDFLPPGITSCSGMDTCLYATLYHEDEEEYSFGSIIQDQLNLTPNLFPEFTFLCTQNNSKRMFPNNASGILGLGRDTNASFLSQTHGTYGSKFSYCLPHLNGSVGFLSLGSTTNDDDDGVEFTPLVANNTSLYMVKITSITIGGNKTFLPILSHTLEAVVDTGLKYTRLPPDVYDALNGNFTDRMKNEMKYSSAINYTSDDGLLMTCFDITGKEAINAPNVRFTFEGNVTVGLDIFNLLDVVETNRTACLAFVRNNHTTDAVVFGTTQQKTMEVVYDLPNNRLGFRTIKACT